MSNITSLFLLLFLRQPRYSLTPGVSHQRSSSRNAAAACNAVPTEPHKKQKHIEQTGGTKRPDTRISNPRSAPNRESPPGNGTPSSTGLRLFRSAGRRASPSSAKQGEGSRF